MPASIGPEICGDLGESLRREWLEANGTGTYASSTIVLCHTRRYHGLLVAHLADPPGRLVLLSHYEDSLLLGDRELALACHQYPGAIHPQGHRNLVEFRALESPTFVYDFGDVRLRKQVLLAHRRDTVLVRYELLAAPSPLLLRLRPLLAYRGFHELQREGAFPQARSAALDHGFKAAPGPGLPPLYVQCSQPAHYLAAPDWYRRFEYAAEAVRGFDSHEDLFQPGLLDLKLAPGSAVVVAAGLHRLAEPPDTLWAAELARRRAARPRPPAHPASDAARFLAAAVEAGRPFLVHTPDGRDAVIAGYPWFGDWSRDTLISLAGLTLHSGRPEAGLAILRSYARWERDGLLPNYFNADGRHAYNSADASLWFIRAVQQYAAHTNDWASVRAELWPVIRRIVHAFRHGTHHAIGLNPDGLLHAGGPDTQLTWMDATVNGQPVTPRHGYAVELNALWYNALRFGAELAARFGETPDWDPSLADRLAAVFREAFWLPGEQCLADVCGEGRVDRSIRPNQIFAAALPHTPLRPDEARAVVETVKRELLTPFGLRTLSPRDSAYRGRYAGGPAERDGAYHQGTVWPWLLGPYADALLATAPDPVAAGADLLRTIRPLLHFCFEDPGMGHVPEIFDGDAPHEPRGCIAQAWSTAELIRLLSRLS